MFRANFVVEALIIGATLAINGVRCPPVKFEHDSQLGQSAADIAFMPGVDRGPMNLFFFLAQLVVFLLLPVYFADQLQGPRLFRPELQNILQRLPRMNVGMIVDVLSRQPVPVLDLPFAAPIFDSALERQSRRIVRLDLQSFLQLLQGERIFLLLESRPCRIEQLPQSLAPHGSIKLSPQRSHSRIHVAFGLQLSENFSGKLQIAILQRLGSPLQPGASAFRIEYLNRLIPHRLAQGIAQIAGAGEPMPRLLRHSLMHHATHCLAHRSVYFRGGSRNLMQNGIHHFIGAPPLKWMPPSQRLITNHTQRKNIGGRGQRLHLNLLRRHVEQSSLLRPRTVGVRHVRHAEIDNLHRVVFHHEDVARLQVPMNQTTLVGRLQTAAGLRNNLNRTLNC